MLAIWLPSVFLGVVANKATDVPAISAKIEARATLAAAGPTLDAASARLNCAPGVSGDDVILKLVEGYAPVWLASLLGAAVMAAVMASDSQILALSTMFTEDVFTFYGGTARFGPSGAGADRPPVRRPADGRRVLIALEVPQSIFDLASAVRVRRLLGARRRCSSRRCSGAAARSGARSRSRSWTAAAVAAIAILQSAVPAPPPGTATTVLSIGGIDAITRAAAGTMVFGLLPVVPMTVRVVAADDRRLADDGRRKGRPPRLWRVTSESG